MTDTAQTVINTALKHLGVIGAGETPDADTSTDALQVLNDMLEAWSIDQRTVYAERLISHTLTVSDGQYSIASTGGDITAARPDNILSAFVRDSNTDYPLKIITQQQYDDIGDKTTTGVPRFLFYDPTFSTGTVYLHPLPDSAYTLKMRAKTKLGPFTALSDAFSLPDGYRRAIAFNLAVEAAPTFQITPSGWLLRQAQDSLDLIARVNWEPVLLQNDAVHLGHGGRAYDIYSDE